MTAGSPDKTGLEIGETTGGFDGAAAAPAGDASRPPPLPPSAAAKEKSDAVEVDGPCTFPLMAIMSAASSKCRGCFIIVLRL